MFGRSDWSQVMPRLVKKEHPKFKVATGQLSPSSPVLLTTPPTRRGSYAIYLNVGTLKNNDAFANPGDGATESLGRAMDVVVFRGQAQQASEIASTDAKNWTWPSALPRLSCNPQQFTLVDSTPNLRKKNPQ